MATEKIEIIKGDAKIIFYPVKHAYRLDGQKTYLLSPSSIVGMLDKSRALIIWATRLAHDYICNYIESNNVAELPASLVKEISFEASEQHNKRKEQAADVGSLIHEYAEGFAKYKMGLASIPEVPDVSEVIQNLSKEDAASMQEMVENGIKSYLTWVKDHSVEYVKAEYFIYNPDEGYAGMTDAIAVIDGKMTVLDYKTGKRIYSSHRYQLAGYYLALPYDDIRVEQGAILLFNKEDGTFVYESYSKDELVKDAEVFLALAVVKRREKILSKW